MKLKIIFIMITFLLLLSTFVQAKTYFSISINYLDGGLSLKKIGLVENEESFDFTKESGDYSFILNSFRGVKLFERKFEITTIINPIPPEDWFDENGTQIKISEEIGDVELEKTSKVIFVPYFNNAKEGLIEKDGEVVLSINLEEYSVCNENGVCDNVEDYLTCPSDCKKLSWWQQFIMWLENLF